MEKASKLIRALARFKSYWAKVALALDLLGNVVFGGPFGETISARVGMSKYWWEREVGKGLNLLQVDHVQWARVHDAQRAIQALRILGYDVTKITIPLTISDLPTPQKLLP